MTAFKCSSSYRLKLSCRAVSGKVKESDKHIMMLNDDMIDTGVTASRDITVSGQKHVHKGAHE